LFSHPWRDIPTFILCLINRCELDRASAEALTGSSSSKSYVVVWTTTPWSLVGNRAICFSSNAAYVIIKRPGDDAHYIVGKELLMANEDLREMFSGYSTVKEINGHSLSGCNYVSPLGHLSNLCPLLPGDHVTMEMGTGLVHTAPSHGQEDYLVGIQHGLDLSCPVDNLGCYDDNQVGIFK
jgi:isoleucyl-tRNA synthetase